MTINKRSTGINLKLKVKKNFVLCMKKATWQVFKLRLFIPGNNIRFLAEW